VLRIAFDLDGVLADMDGELARHAEALFGERAVRAREAPAPDAGDAPPIVDATAPDQPEEVADSAPPAVSLNLGPRQTHRLWEHVQSIENFWETLTEIEPGVIARLAAVAAERRWEVLFVTKRPRSAGVTAQLQTQRWLASKGFALPSVFVVQGSRGRIAASLALDVVVDDRPENCLDVVVDSKARAMLVWRADAQQLPEAVQRLGIRVVKSVAECLDILTEPEPAREAPGLMTRMKRALGMKEPV
jgi:hypothetical protein